MSLERKTNPKEFIIRDEFFDAIEKRKPLEEVKIIFEKYEHYVDCCKSKGFAYHHEIEDEIETKYKEYKQLSKDC